MYQIVFIEWNNKGNFQQLMFIAGNSIFCEKAIAISSMAFYSMWTI